MAFAARTNKNTQLIRLGGDNVDVAAGTRITVHNEHGQFGTVSVPIQGVEEFGSMLTSAYDPV
jgi:hypothetical protein